MYNDIFYKASEFQCQKCGKCCHFNKDINVGLVIGDINSISEKMDLTMNQFVSKYCKIEYSPNDIPKDVDNHYISMLKERGILIYDYLPSFVSNKRSKYHTSLSLRTEGKTCMFYNEGCTIHTYKPIMCEIYPFEMNFILPLTYYDNDCTLKNLNNNKIILPSDLLFEKYSHLRIQNLIIDEYFKMYKYFDEYKFNNFLSSIPNEVIIHDVPLLRESLKFDFAYQLVSNGILNDIEESKSIWYKGI